MSIRLLPSEVASQIAAGEVVERPASVVKELLENALDAGARTVTIRVEGAGQRLIEIADDGCGIPAEELPLAIERHATSKLQEAADLFAVETLGFRGEALASIGSVSTLTVTSRPAEAAVAGRIRVQGGIPGPVEPVGAPAGTVMRVENLFYNVPARLKFLKADATERRQIDALVTRYALAYPQARLHLHQEGRPSLQTSGNGDRREVLAALYGVDVARQMLEVLAEDDMPAEGDSLRGKISIGGFISPPSLTRSNRREIGFFVNGRPVQDSALAAAVLKGYHTLLMVGRYPLAILFIEMPPDAVDVNVHPTKAEVRFRHPERVFSGVQRAVRRALLAHSPVPDLAEQMHWDAAEVSAPLPGGGSLRRMWETETWERTGAEAQASNAEEALPAGGLANFQAPAAPSLPGTPAAILRLVGQIAATYLVAEGPDGLYLIDQHAAHERVLFEKLMAQHDGRMPSQALLVPAVVDLPPAGARLIAEQLPVLANLGFEVEAFGHAAFLVRAVPQLLARMDPAAALRVLVEDFEEDESPLREEIEAKIVARVCKRAAVKAGQILSPEEQRSLLADLEACQSPRTCPHGRPTMIHLSVNMLERQFGRKA
ncbi:MAG: DNA mismatch repair endonuclease MutL [Chloroflexota bacterium]